MNTSVSYISVAIAINQALIYRQLAQRESRVQPDSAVAQTFSTLEEWAAVNVEQLQWMHNEVGSTLNETLRRIMAKLAPRPVIAQFNRKGDFGKKIFPERLENMIKGQS